MSMRTFSVALTLILVGCGTEPAVENKVTQAKADDQIECALGGTGDFTRNCAIERGEGTNLTLRHEDGGFRRLTLEADGTIDTADGADVLTLQPLSDGRTEIRIGDDSYRLPATL
jgi:hypothetical protein